MKLFASLKKYPLFEGDDFVRRVLTIAIPIILQRMVTSLVNLLDNLMVGQLGEYPITAVAASNKYFLIALFAFTGITDAASIYISQYLGAKNHKRVQESYRYSLIAPYLIAVVILTPAMVWPTQIGHFFTPETNITGYVAEYMPIAALAYIPMIYSLATQSAMRVEGDTKRPLYLTLLAVFSNAFFNYILIFGHFGAAPMGVKGAAIGTLLARTLEMVATWILSHRGGYTFKTRFRDLLDIPKNLMVSISERALPLLVNEIGYSGGMALLFKFYGTRGSDVLSAMTIMGTTSELFFVLFSGMAVATTVIVGGALGSGELERARSLAYRLYKLALLLSGAFATLLFLSSYIVPELYQVADSTKDLAAFFIRLYAIFYFFYTFNSMAYFILRAGGEMRFTLLMDSVYFWTVNIPVVGLAAYLTDWPIQVMFIMGQITDLFKCFISSHVLAKETWIHNITAEIDGHKAH